MALVWVLVISHHSVGGTYDFLDMALVWVPVISHHSVGGRRVEELGVLELFHPIVARWFRRAFGRPTPPQALGWPPSQKESIL